MAGPIEDLSQEEYAIDAKRFAIPRLLQSIPNAMACFWSGGFHWYQAETKPADQAESLQGPKHPRVDSKL